MQKHVGWLWCVGFFGCLGAAAAQAPPPGTGFDGTYRLVSSTPLNAIYTTRKGQTAPCPNRRAGPLHIVHGQAHYTSASGYRLAGTVGPQGELTMSLVAPGRYAANPIDLNVSGSVENNGTVRVRQLGHSCSYDFVWQKAAR